MKQIKISLDEEELQLLNDLNANLGLREKTGFYKRVLFDLNISPIILLKSAMIIKDLNSKEKNKEYSDFVSLLERLVPYNEQNKVPKLSKLKKDAEE